MGTILRKPTRKVPMANNGFLTGIDRIDCDGRVSHTLTLEIDGTVRVELPGGRVARIDPGTRQNLTPHVPVPTTVIDQAVHLRPW